MEELLVGVASVKLVVEALTIRDSPLGPANPILFGEGSGLSLRSVSLCTDITICFENSFIFDFSPFCL
jgi:hypothetical protein